MMTIKRTQERVDEIEKLKGDDESAHAAEDDLYSDFIITVSKRKDKLGKIAKIILTTTKIDFARWCA